MDFPFGRISSQRSMADYRQSNEKYYNQLKEQFFDSPHAIELAQRSMSRPLLYQHAYQNNSVEFWHSSYAFRWLMQLASESCIWRLIRLFDLCRAAKAFRQVYDFDEDETTVMDFACGVGT